jgi:hypothetical protein
VLSAVQLNEADAGAAVEEPDQESSERSEFHG